MNKLQFISLLVPTIGSFVLVVLAWVYSNAQLGRIENTAGQIEYDLREFYRIPGKLEGRVEELTRK